MFLDFSQFPFWVYSPAGPPEEGWRVTVIDLRWGTPIAPRFLVSALVRPGGEVEGAAFRFDPVRPSLPRAQ